MEALGYGHPQIPCPNRSISRDRNAHSLYGKQVLLMPCEPSLWGLLLSLGGNKQAHNFINDILGFRGGSILLSEPPKRLFS